MAGPRDNDDEIDGIEDEADEDREEGSDAGRIDDEGGDDAEARQEPEEFEAQERVDRRSRRDDRIREELRAEREHRARVEAELQQYRQEREQRQYVSQEETEEQFQARISLLDPEQRMDEKLNRANRIHNRQLALQTFALADRQDKASYDAKAAHDPIYRKYAQEVEQVLMIERRKGRDFDRETILDFVRGRRARMNQSKASPAQQRGRENIQRQQARTTGGRGDQPRTERQRRYAPGDMSPEAVRQRLEAPDAFI